MGLVRRGKRRRDGGNPPRPPRAARPHEAPLRIDEPSETARLEESLTPEAGAATRRTFLAAAGAMAIPLLLEKSAAAAGGANEARRA